MIPAGDLKDLLAVIRRVKTPEADVLVEEWRKKQAELPGAINELLNLADQYMPSRRIADPKKRLALLDDVRDALQQPKPDEGKRLAPLLNYPSVEAPTGETAAAKVKEVPPTRAQVKRELHKVSRRSSKNGKAAPTSVKHFDLDWSRELTLANLGKVWKMLKPLRWELDKIPVDSDNESYVFKNKAGTGLAFIVAKGGDFVFEMMELDGKDNDKILPVFIQQRNKLGTDQQGVPPSLASADFDGSFASNEARAYMSSWTAALDYVKKLADSSRPVKTKASLEMPVETAAPHGYAKYEWRTYRHDKGHYLKKKSTGQAVHLQKGHKFGIRPATTAKGKMRLVTHELGKHHIFTYDARTISRLMAKSRPGRRPKGTKRRIGREIIKTA